MDVGMTLPKRKKQVQHICTKRGYVGSLYTSRQGMTLGENLNFRMQDGWVKVA